MANKREKDRESGTGQPIKSIPSKGGSGKGNWGSDQEQIKQGMDSATAAANGSGGGSGNRRPRNEPNSFGDLNESEANKPKQSWDEFNKGKKKTEVYNVKSVKSDYRKKYKPTAYEKETDAMFAGDGKKRRRNKQKKKKKKVLLQTAVHFNEENKNLPGRARVYNNMRGGGYRGGRGARGGNGGNMIYILGSSKNIGPDPYDDHGPGSHILKWKVHLSSFIDARVSVKEVIYKQGHRDGTRVHEPPFRFSGESFMANLDLEVKIIFKDGRKAICVSHRVNHACTGIKVR